MMTKIDIGIMHTQDTYENIRRELDNAGIVFRLIPYHHLDEITSVYSEFRATGIIHDKVFNAYLAYLDKDKSTKFPEAVSLFITATPQPQLRVTFHTEEQTIRGIIPPTYAKFHEGEGAEPILKRSWIPLVSQLSEGMYRSNEWLCKAVWRNTVAITLPTSRVRAVSTRWPPIFPIFRPLRISGGIR